MEFMIKALDSFRNTNLKEADAIVNIGKDNKTTQKGSYYGGIGRIFFGPLPRKPPTTPPVRNCYVLWATPSALKA